MVSLFYGLVSYAAIAILPSYGLYAFSLSQLNNAFAVAFILSDVLLTENKIQAKNIWPSHY